MEVDIIFREHIDEPLKKHTLEADSIAIGCEAIFITTVDGSHIGYERVHNGFLQIKAVKNTGD